MKPTSKMGANLGRGCGSLFFGVFASMGLFFCGLICMSMWTAVSEYTWKEADCTILTSRLGEKGKKYVVELSYRYEFGGREFTGTRLRSSSNEFDDARAPQHALQRYPEDSRSKCFVNPSAPEQSVLERGSLWFGLMLLFPLVFVAIGIAGIVGVWREKPAGEIPISERNRKANATGRWILLIFAVAFTLAGVFGLYVLLIRPVTAKMTAANWKEIPCVITTSRINSHSDGEGGATYSLDIRYRYEVGGRNYIGNRYHFATGSSSGKSWRQQILENYPAGLQTVCYVDPADPVESVLKRESGVEWYVVIPAIFLIVGVGLWIGVTRPEKRAVPQTAVSLRTDGPAKLHAANPPLGGCIVIGIVATIWNGITWGVLLGGDLPTVGKVFLSIFALIGAGLIAGVVHKFLSLFNPKPELTARSSAAPLGGTIELDFRMTGNVKRIARLHITLEGREAATYRRGTNTATDKSVFAEISLLDTRDRAAMTGGTLSTVVPSDSMHTFDAPNNKITWLLRVRGEIPNWPDVDAEYPVIVLPAAKVV